MSYATRFSSVRDDFDDRSDLPNIDLMSLTSEQFGGIVIKERERGREMIERSAIGKPAVRLFSSPEILAFKNWNFDHDNFLIQLSTINTQVPW